MISVIKTEVRYRRGSDVGLWNCGVHPVVEEVFSPFAPDEALLDEHA